MLEYLITSLIVIMPFVGLLVLFRGYRTNNLCLKRIGWFLVAIGSTAIIGILYFLASFCQQ